MIHWITPSLGTAPFGADALPAGAVCVDIRVLVDRQGNSSQSLMVHVNTALALLAQGANAVICCDHGISRSNAVAAAVLSRHEGIPLSAAIRRVLAATGGAEMRLDVLDSVRAALAAEGEVAAPGGGKRWLLTGGSGYLGCALRASVPEGIELVCPGRAELDLLQGSVPIDLLVREQGISRILHFASPHVGNTNSSLGESLVMLRNVLDVCVGNDLPVLVPSRWEVFAGYKGLRIQADEMTPLRPAGVLGDARFLAEELVQQFVQRSGLKATVLRSGIVYGDRSGPNFMRSFIKHVRAGNPITTHIYANGEPELDLLHVDDWVDGCWKALQGDCFDVYHCGTGSLTGTHRIATMIVEAAGGAQHIEQIELQDDVANIGLNSARLHRATGWAPTIAAEAGIPAFVRQFIEQEAN